MATTADMTTSRLEELLGDDAQSLLQHESQTVSKDNLHLPGPDDFARCVFAAFVMDGDARAIGCQTNGNCPPDAAAGANTSAV